MRRPSSTLVSSLFEAIACLAATLTACLSSETIDLGSNYDAGRPAPDSAEPGAPESAVESGVDAVADAPAEAGADSSDAPDDVAAVDAPVAPAALCVPNRSFESIPSGDALAQGPLLTAPPQWQACSSSATMPKTCILPPTDGSSYLGLSIGFAPFLLNPASVDATLCQTLEAGVTYSLTIDLALDASPSDASPTGEPPALQVRASTTACDPQADLLVRFSGATNTCGWRTSLCGTFTPQQVYSHLILIPEASSSTGLVFSQTNVLVDNLRSGGTCPTL
jgi:hypothetical protein